MTSILQDGAKSQLLSQPLGLGCRGSRKHLPEERKFVCSRLRGPDLTSLNPKDPTVPQWTLGRSFQGSYFKITAPAACLWARVSFKQQSGWDKKLKRGAGVELMLGSSGRWKRMIRNRSGFPQFHSLELPWKGGVSMAIV